MEYNVSQLLKESTGATQHHTLEAKFTEKGRFADSVIGEVHFLRTHQGVQVRVEADAQVRHTCGRCLVEFTEGSAMMLEEEFFPQVDVVTGGPLVLPEDPDELLIGENHVLDLTEALRQYVVSNKSMKPLCREGCLGLCQECGVRLNKEKCNCGEGRRDSRWDALTALLQDSKG